MTVGPAGRFLHICYCCTSDQVEKVVAMFADSFGFRHTMSTPLERGDGSILGLEGEVLSGTAFVYDPRGPRTSPAIEVQGWVDPPVAGKPIDDPAAAGILALGIAVADVDAAAKRLEGVGCTPIGRDESPFRSAWLSVRDVTGVTLDLVEDTRLEGSKGRMAHLRIGTTDLVRSIAWYEGLGFRVLEQTEDPDADGVRLRLPEEPFEAVLVQRKHPPTRGRHPGEPYHAGLFRTAVRVQDTRESHRAMAAAGWQFDRPPKSVELRGTPVPDMWICFLSDPDGVPFEFVERPASAFRD